MKSRSNRLGLALAGFAAVTVGYAATGCSSDKGTNSDNGTGGSTSSTGGAGNNGTGNAATGTGATGTGTCSGLTIAFAPDMYSAFIPGGMHTFQLPVMAQGVSDATLEWSAADPSIVDIQPGDTAGGRMLTMLKAGTTVITAKTKDGKCAQSTLHVTDATEDQWQAGSMRYNNKNPLPPIMTDGGVPTNLMGYVIDPPGMPPACTNCHGDTATNNVFKTISHTPEQTGGFSDDQLKQIFTMGSVPNDGYFDQTLIPNFIWSFFHKWSDITGDQAQGMVVYLRSLAPKAQGGNVDFGMFRVPGLRPPGGGNGGSTSTGSGGSTSTSSGGSTSTGGTKSSGGAAGAAGSGGGAAGSAGAAGASSGGSAGAAGAAGAHSGGASGSAGAAGAAGSK